MTNILRNVISIWISKPPEYIYVVFYMLKTVIATSFNCGQ